MLAADGKPRLTDVATAETLLRLVQSIPSPKAEPIKFWLAKVGYERMQEMADPALSLNRARQTWQQYGCSDKWHMAHGIWHMDRPAHDRAGNPQQTNRLLGWP